MDADWVARGTAIGGVAIALFSIYWSIHIWKRQGPVLRVKALGFTRQFARIETDEHRQPVYDEDGHPVYKGDQPHIMRTMIWGSIKNIGRFDARAQDAWFILNEVRPWPNPVHWWKTRRLFQRVDVSSGDLNIQREDSSFPIRLPAQGSIKFEIAVAPDVRDAKPKGPLRDDWELLENWVKAERPVMLVIRTGSGKTIHARVRYMRPEEFRQAVEDL